MSQNSLKDAVTSMPIIPQERSESCGESDQARRVSSSATTGEELIPYSPKELKYLCSLWDEVQRHQEPGLPYIYVGAVGVILTGWLLSGVEQSLLSNLGGILMLAGGLIGTWFSLKTLRHQKHSAPRE